MKLGWFLRAMHGWGSDFMIAIVLIHMAQVFLFGAYKFPRELTWIIGVFLLLLTLGMAFTGQVSAVRSGCLLGSRHWGFDREPRAVDWRLAGRHDAGRADHCRAYADAFFCAACVRHSGNAACAGGPASLDGAAAWHQRLADAGADCAEEHIRCRNITNSRRRPASRSFRTPPGKMPSLRRRSCWRSLPALFIFGPFGPTGQPDPTIIQTAPKPDFAFLWIYAVLAYLPPSLETPVLFIAPVLGIGAMLLLPLVAGEGEKHWSRRPVAVLMLAVIAVTLGVFTRLGTYTPWSPIMDAWTRDPIPAAYLHGRTPLERQGAIVLQDKQCRNCHSIGGAGGLRGPALDSIAARMTEDQIIRQVLQGGGNMPAYGNALDPVGDDCAGALPHDAAGQ